MGNKFTRHSMCSWRFIRDAVILAASISGLMAYTTKCNLPLFWELSAIVVEYTIGFWFMGYVISNLYHRAKTPDQEYRAKSLSQKTFTLDIENDPHGWIQFKGTTLCMDVHCECGCHYHVDGMFGYFVKCPECGIVYECNGHIQLLKADVDKDETRILTQEDYFDDEQ